MDPEKTQLLAELVEVQRRHGMVVRWHGTLQAGHPDDVMKVLCAIAAMDDATSWARATHLVTIPSNSDISKTKRKTPVNAIRDKLRTWRRRVDSSLTLVYDDLHLVDRRFSARVGPARGRAIEFTELLVLAAKIAIAPAEREAGWRRRGVGIGPSAAMRTGAARSQQDNQDGSNTQEGSDTLDTPVGAAFLDRGTRSQIPHDKQGNLRRACARSGKREEELYETNDKEFGEEDGEEPGYDGDESSEAIAASAATSDYPSSSPPPSACARHHPKDEPHHATLEHFDVGYAERGTSPKMMMNNRQPWREIDDNDADDEREGLITSDTRVNRTIESTDPICGDTNIDPDIEENVESNWCCTSCWKNEADRMWLSLRSFWREYAYAI